MVNGILQEDPNTGRLILNEDLTEFQALSHFEKTMFQVQKHLYSLANLGVKFSLVFTLPQMETISNEEHAKLNVIHMGNPVQLMSAGVHQILNGKAYIHQDTERKYVHRSIKNFWQAVKGFESNTVNNQEIIHVETMQKAYGPKFDKTASYFVRHFNWDNKKSLLYHRWNERFNNYKWAIDKNETNVLKRTTHQPIITYEDTPGPVPQIRPDGRKRGAKRPRKQSETPVTPASQIIAQYIEPDDNAEMHQIPKHNPFFEEPYTPLLNAAIGIVNLACTPNDSFASCTHETLHMMDPTAPTETPPLTVNPDVFFKRCDSESDSNHTLIYDDEDDVDLNESIF